MLDASGGFHSSEDADSEGVEGKFYVWTPSEVREILGDEIGSTFCELYDVKPGGNFEGRSILNIPVGYAEFAEQNNIDKSELRSQMREAREKLLGVRSQRVRPGRDDKILTSWNALAIDGFAFARATESTAANAIEFIVENMLGNDGRLQHSYRHGKVKIDAFLEDYAYLINALVTASQTAIPFRVGWLDIAVKLADTMVELFADDKNGGFYFTPIHQTDLIARYKDHHDGSVPSGNAMAAYALLRLARLTGNERWSKIALQTVQWALPFVKRSPMACGQMLLAIDLYLAAPQEIVLVLPEAFSLDDIPIRFDQYWLPYASVICATENSLVNCDSIASSVSVGKSAIDDQPTLYVCSNFSCQAPITDFDEARAKLLEISSIKYE